MGVSKVRFSTVVIVMIVLMRVAAGWHFMSEGQKKLDPGFERVSEGFLRGAKGPLAEHFHAMAPGPHRAYELLVAPRDATAEQDAAASAAWSEQILADWQAEADRATAALGGGEEAAAEVEAIRAAAANALACYFNANGEVRGVDGEEPAIAEYRHELWRLEQMKAGYEPGTLPFQDDRIAEKSREVAGTPGKWVAAIQAMDFEYGEALSGLATEERLAKPGTAKRLADALDPPTTLDAVNLAVLCAVLGSGVCLFLGAFTRVAAIVAAGFLLSVMVTQPPWVVGANTEYFFYQLFEATGLLTLAAVGAGRWLGLDGLFVAVSKMCCHGETGSEKNS